MAIKINGSTIIDDSRKGVNFDSVGIGTTNPVTKLHLSGTGTQQIRVDTSGTALSIHDHSEFIGFIGNDAGKLFINAGGTEDTLSLRTAGIEKLRITSGGLVGIGTDNPDTLLHLQSNNPILKITDANQATDNKSWNISAGTAQILRIQAINDSGTGGGKLFDFYRSGTQIQKFLGKSGTDYWFVVDNDNERVGIGTTNATANLDVDGTLNVSGVSTFHRIDGQATLEFNSTLETYDPAGGTGTDTANDAAIALPSGQKIVGYDDGYIRNLLSWTNSSDIVIGQQNTSKIRGIELKPGNSAGVKLHYGGSTDNLKLETTGYGATITGGLEVSGIVTASSYRGDGSQLTGVEAASFLFNTGITSSVSTVATGVGSTILTLPSLDGQKYIIHSILASNIAVGNTEVNFVGAFDFDGGERSYFANQIPIPTGTSVEMLKQPQVLNPNDSIIVRSTDFDRVGADNIIDVYVSYEEKTSTDLIGIGIGTVGLAATSTTGIYTSSTYPSVVQSIRLVNKVDTGPKIASVSISNGVSTTFLVDNLIVPKYGSIEILDNPKSIQTNDVVQVQLDEGASINVQLSAKKITN